MERKTWEVVGISKVAGSDFFKVTFGTGEREATMTMSREEAMDYRIGDTGALDFMSANQPVAMIAAPVAEPAKRGRKPGQKNKAKLLDNAGNEIKNAATNKAYKKQGAYSKEDAEGILAAIKANKHEVDPKFKFRLQWLASGKRLMKDTDEQGHGFTQAWEAHQEGKKGKAA